MNYIHSYDDYNKAITNFMIPNSVVYKTIHQAKGEEADLIVVIDTATQFEINDMVNEDEERRVWYVAVTRAKKHLIIAEGDSEKQTKFLPQLKF